MQTASSCSEEKTKPGHSVLPYREGTKANRGKAQKPLYFILFHTKDTLFSVFGGKNKHSKTDSQSLCVTVVGHRESSQF